MRERLYYEMFVEGKRIDIENSLKRGKPIPSLTKYISGLFSIVAYWENKEILDDHTVLNDGDTLVFHRVPCDTAVVQRYSQHYQQLSAPYSNRPYIKRNASEEHQRQCQYESAVEQRLGAMLYAVGQQFTEEKAASCLWRDQQALCAYAVQEAVRWNMALVEKPAKRLRAPVAEERRSCAGIPHDMLREATTEKEKRNAMVTGLGKLVVYKNFI